MKTSFPSVLMAALAVNTAIAQIVDTEVTYPEHPNIIDITRPPYGAKGDGVTDDTAALQRAINEHTGRHHVLFFPPGTYLVTATLTWPKRWEGRDNWGFTTLQGQSASKCIIRLKDGTFSDAEKPQSILWCGGFGSADWFHNHVHGLTFNVGRNNPGAIGLQFYANNYGAVRNCHIISEDGQGVAGLDLGHRDMNGPLLVRHVTVCGFRRGIVTAHAVNSQTFEHIILTGQTQFGFDNEGQSISIRGLTSDNTVPALRSYGALCLLEAKLTGRAGASELPAIINYNQGRMFLRDIVTVGYGRALGDVTTPDYVAAYRIRGPDKAGSAGPTVAEYSSHPVTSPFPSRLTSLRLPILETPDAPRDDPASWATVDDFGADPTAQQDSSKAIQQAMDSGASTIFFPGHYALASTILVRGNVRRVLGIGGQVDYAKKVSPDFRVLAGASDVVTFEHFANVGGGIENTTNRTLVLRSIGSQVFSRGTGTLFLEDVAGHELSVKNQTVFARQLNIENEGTHLLNDGRQRVDTRIQDRARWMPHRHATGWFDRSVWHFQLHDDAGRTRPHVHQRQLHGLRLLPRGLLQRGSFSGSDPGNKRPGYESHPGGGRKHLALQRRSRRGDRTDAADQPAACSAAPVSRTVPTHSPVSVSKW